MQQHDGVTRREFVVSTTGAAVGALVAGHAGVAAAPQAKRRYAIVGTGVRAIGMWGRPILRDYPDLVEMVGLCDINPLRVEVAKKQMGATCPTFTDHVSRFHVVPRHLARRGLLPALAPSAREERFSLGAQGVAPLRPRQLVD